MRSASCPAAPSEFLADNRRSESLDRARTGEPNEGLPARRRQERTELSTKAPGAMDWALKIGN